MKLSRETLADRLQEQLKRRCCRAACRRAR